MIEIIYYFTFGMWINLFKMIAYPITACKVWYPISQGFSKWYHLGFNFCIDLFSIVTLGLLGSATAEQLMWYGPIYPFFIIPVLCTPYYICQWLK